MNMSRSIRRTLICRALVLGVISACRAAGGVSATKPGGLILDRLQRHADELVRHVSGGRDTVTFDRRSERAYKASLRAVQSGLLANLPEEVDPREYLAAVLVWVEDARAALPPYPPERRWAWFRLAEQLQALSELMDPLREDAPMDAGVGYAEALKQASGVWA